MPMRSKPTIFETPIRTPIHVLLFATMATNDPCAMAHSSNQKSTASKLRFHLRVIEERMAGLESQMALLRQERDAVLTDLAAVVYPVLTLPNEIISEIFLLSVDKS
jgi:hypothetical protein